MGEQDSAAWLLCSIDADWCTLAGIGDSAYAPGLRAAASNYSAVIRASATGAAEAVDAWHAHQYCFVVTLAQVGDICA